MECWSFAKKADAFCFAQYSNTSLLHHSFAESFLFIPLQDYSVHNAADLEQLLLVVHHFRASEPSDGVVFA